MRAQNRTERDEDRVFKALSDPTRRRILDRLRERPATVGQVADGFELSRFGVMKHLRVLQEARLVLVEARGRERWNRVNPLPIRDLYHRWIRPFEEAASDQLIRLKRRVEADARPQSNPPEEQAMTEFKTPSESEFSVIHLVVEVEINADRTRVWKALVDEIGDWWHPAFYTGGTPGGMRLEATLGGRMLEEWGDGDGLIWGVVNGIRSEEMLEVVNDTSRAWGGPSRGFLSWALESSEAGTKLRFEQSQYGVVSEKTAESLSAGWTFLFRRCLKPWVESGQDPASVPFEEECQAES